MSERTGRDITQHRRKIDVRPRDLLGLRTLLQLRYGVAIHQFFPYVFVQALPFVLFYVTALQCIVMVLGLLEWITSWKCIPQIHPSSNAHTPIISPIHPVTEPNNHESLYLLNWDTKSIVYLRGFGIFARWVDESYANLQRPRTVVPVKRAILHSDLLVLS